MTEGTVIARNDKLGPCGVEGSGQGIQGAEGLVVVNALDGLGLEERVVCRA